jgi:hypothetical protein
MSTARTRGFGEHAVLTNQRPRYASNTLTDPHVTGEGTAGAVSRATTTSIQDPPKKPGRTPLSITATAAALTKVMPRELGAYLISG